MNTDTFKHTAAKPVAISNNNVAVAPATAMAHTPKGWGGLTVLQRVEHAQMLARAAGMQLGKPTHVGK